jgi:hypothetical protein
LICGGVMTSGRFLTFGVVGEYCISSSNSLRKTTPPGVVAKV